LGAFENNILVGVLILTKLSSVEVKMRQVAVLENRQNQNIGYKLVKFSEEYAKEAGYLKIVLNARKTAVGFYEKLGYEKFGDEFLEINIPHYKMLKIF
jgi:predicted GNAT family N-acyltransferase